MQPQVIVIQNKLIVDFIGSAGFQFSSSQVKTFSGANLGAAAPTGFDKYVVASLNHLENLTAIWAMSSVTIDGQSATIAQQQFQSGAGWRTQTTFSDCRAYHYH